MYDTLRMKSAFSSETLLPIYRITRRHIPQYGNGNGIYKYVTATYSFYQLCHIPRLGRKCLDVVILLESVAECARTSFCCWPEDGSL